MRIHLLKHGTLKDNVTIEAWAEDMGLPAAMTVLVDGDKLPQPDDFDWLIVLGGLMNVHEEEKYPWLVEEKRFIREAVHSGRVVLGICFGAQLVAEALGARVYKNEYKEIGWQPVRLTPEAKQSPVFRTFPDWFSVFQWHEYTFALPDGALLIAENDACRNQVFEYDGGRVIGVQFHPEYNNDCIRELTQKYYDSVGEGTYIQPKEEILVEHCLIREIDALLDLMLSNISDTFGGE